MDFITKLPKTSSGYETLWVVVDKLTKPAHFLPIKEINKTEKLTYHPQTNGQITWVLLSIIS